MSAVKNGSCRWLEPCPVMECPRLRITSNTQAGPVTHVYDVVDRRDGTYDLWRLDPETFELLHYTCHPMRQTCTCKSQRYSGRCKHAMALRAALLKAQF